MNIGPNSKFPFFIHHLKKSKLSTRVSHFSQKCTISFGQKFLEFSHAIYLSHKDRTFYKGNFKNHDTVARGSASLTFVTYVMYVKYIASTLPKIGQLHRLKTLEIVIFFRTYQYIHLLRLHPGILISSTKQTSLFEEEK